MRHFWFLSAYVVAGCGNADRPFKPDMGTWCGGLLAAQQHLLATVCEKSSDCSLVASCCGSANYVPQGTGSYFYALSRNMKEDCAVGPEPSACDGRPNLPRVCLSGHCEACLQVDTPCADGSHCCSLACLDGRCACGIMGTPCRHNTDCCSGVCADPDQSPGGGCRAYCR